ncbi:pyridoxal phosphate-dependent aminotransferase [Faecalibaculum rodentium]|jgi:LL-diaminopimelate aminotransferase|uniref:pyridoxal phosphate-dependent aminotransferase n=1 Tax=Faecalibaculum rodentium TaxID=1702221 RepID=UPI00248B0412|nr:aminotransferase class I/II-fold pyridoxal phosphate-dependent enzyme [Faecalibaculum rodentium]
MIRAARRVQEIQGATFADLDRKKKRFTDRTGLPVIDFSIGSSNIPPMDAVKETLSQAVQEDAAWQYSLGPLPEMIEAVQDWYQNRYGVDLEADEIFLLKGSQEALTHVPLVYCDPGDTVLIPDPYYPIYGTAPRLAGAAVQFMPLKEENGYLIDFDAIENPDEVKLMYVSYPGNPTGAVANDAFYERLVQFATDHDIIVLHDNAYSELVFEGETGKSFLAYPGAKEVGIELNSFSKSYSMGGARLAVLAGNAGLVQAYRKLLDMTDFCVFPAIQQAGICALKEGQAFTEQVRNEYRRRRDYLIEKMKEAGWNIAVPKATMFVWARIPACWSSAQAFTDALVDQAGVLVNPGSNFGKEGERYVRLALVRSDGEVQEAARRIRESGLLETGDRSQ